MELAKICKYLRFILLPLTLIMLFLVALSVLEYTMPELSASPRPEEEVLQGLITNAIYTAIVLVINIASFVIYASQKKKLKDAKEPQKRVDPGKRRKTKMAIRVLGILAVVFGIIYSMAIPAFAWLTFLGIILIIVSLAIRTREPQNSAKTARFYEGNKVHITYPSKKSVDHYYFDPTECEKIIQDIINDGYTTFETFTQLNSGQVRMTFSTDLSQSELQAQSERRDKYFLENGKNAGDMPEYFSAQPTFKHHYDWEDGRTWSEKEAVYTHDVYDVYKDGEKVGTETRNERFSHNVQVTYRERISTWSFYNSDETPYLSKDGKHLAVSTVDVSEIERKRI